MLMQNEHNANYCKVATKATKTINSEQYLFLEATKIYTCVLKIYRIRSDLGLMLKFIDET